jgi:hypothetical protein
MSHLERACEELDASVFSSDMMYDPERYAMFKEYLSRWNRAVEEHNKAEMTEATPPAQPAPTVQEPLAWCTKSELENMAKGFSQDVPARSMRVPQLYPKESTVLLYTAAQPAPVPTNCRHCGGPDNVLCGGQCKAAQPAPVTTREIDT